MDFSRFTTKDWLLVGGSAAVFIGGLLDWISFDVDGLRGASAANAFDFFFTGTLPWLLIVAAGVIGVLLADGRLKAGGAP